MDWEIVKEHLIKRDVPIEVHYGYLIMTYKEQNKTCRNEIYLYWSGRANMDREKYIMPKEITMIVNEIINEINGNS